MLKNPFLSIVMPVYNTEPYLENAAKSVLNQTYKDFELILINDGSPDKSPVMCDEIAASDPRVRVIHKAQNEGLSAARNTGIDEALGEYICFIDSDDTVEPNLLEQVAESLEKHKADVIIYGLKEEYLTETEEVRQTFVVSYPAKNIDNAEALRKEIIYLEKSTLYGYSWNKFFSLRLIRENNLRFEQVKLIEDFKFSVDFFYHAQAMNILDITPYHYKKRGRGSLTEVFVPEYFEVHRERVFLLKKQHEDWDILSYRVKSILGNIYSRYIFSAIQRNFDERSKLTKSQRKQWLEDLYKDELFNELIPHAQADSAIFKVLTSLLKKKRTFLVLLAGRVIYTVKNKMPLVFTNIQQSR